jgi:hypothetical protein
MAGGCPDCGGPLALTDTFERMNCFTRGVMQGRRQWAELQPPKRRKPPRWPIVVQRPA